MAYVATTDTAERTKLYVEFIQPAFDELVNKIIYTSSSAIYRIAERLDNQRRDQHNRELYSSFKLAAEKLILNYASGFLYYVTITGITGQHSANMEELKKSINLIISFSNLPIMAGFGIKDANDVKKICQIADGAVVGSSIVKIIEQNLSNKKKILELVDKFV